MAGTALAFHDQRGAPRDEVFHRTRATRADGATIVLLIVNLSAMGLMARCESDLAPGERLSLTLPVVGTLTAEVRWALGGRIGCELDRMIPLAAYYDLLAVLLKGR
ncbi:MAG: pilus assembly protein PilZ [Proteobacteria bacterium SG_bin6]|nr:MAG: pilus assembly protein PilZ [Proteobacteria bacterium SG_bin6]